MAIKFHDDEYYDNKFYAKVGGISCLDLNELESVFLKCLDYNLFIMPETYEERLNNLISNNEIVNIETKNQT